MALDEPKDDDQIFEQGTYSLIVDPQTRDIVDQSGGLVIDYVDEEHQKGYMLRLRNAGGGCGSTGGGCDSCG